jgi:hypothetical protein
VRTPGLYRSNSLDSTRLFTFAVIAGTIVVAPFYLWILSDLWSDSPSLLRTAQSNGYGSNFYDLQARAMLHGHLYVANGALGGEAFVHLGHQFTYFGLFPSLLRVPVLAVTNSLDGRLTAISMFLAWVITAVFVSALVWRIRVLNRGSTDLSRLEAVSYGALVASILAGTVLMFLASNPYVFSEDLAWSVALATGCSFALLGLLERPSWGRIAAALVLILAAVLTRATTGYASIIGAVLVSVWFALGRGGPESRRWALPTLVSGLIALIVGCAVSYAKFGILFGLPASEQIVYQTFGLGHVNSGSYFNLRFLPSTLLAYFQPTGIHLTAVFPFITLPPVPAHSVDGAVLFGRARVASVVSSMPLLFLAGLWGTVATFAPRAPGRSKLLRIPLITTAAAAGAVMIFGWIYNPYLADLLPFFVLSSAIGIVDVWGRVRKASTSSRRTALGIIVTLGVFGVVANGGIAITPQALWSTEQIVHYVEFQKSVSDLTGHPQDGDVVRSSALPRLAPGDQLDVVGHCAGLYISDGFGSSGNRGPILNAVDLQTLWRPVELGPSIHRMLNVTRDGRIPVGLRIPIITVGKASLSTTVSVETLGGDAIRFSIAGPYGRNLSDSLSLRDAQTERISIITDPYIHLVSISTGRSELLSANLYSKGIVRPLTQSSPSAIRHLHLSLVESSPASSSMSICRSLQQGSR